MEGFMLIRTQDRGSIPNSGTCIVLREYYMVISKSICPSCYAFAKHVVL